MNYREIGLADIAELFDVRASATENALSREQLTAKGIDEQTVASELGRALHGWLCEGESGIVGYVVVDVLKGELWSIAVLPGYEGRGIGSALLARAEAWLWAEGLTTIWLVTAVDPALRVYRFYRKNGWCDQGTRNGLRFMVKRHP